MNLPPRTRVQHAENYFAVRYGKRILRYQIRDDDPILPLRLPELEDVSLGSRWLANCPYCYTSAVKSGSLYSNVVEKIRDYYGGLSLNDRPFQVAIGGEGEPTLHPEFCQVLRTFHELDIMPNFSTNGMHLTPDVLSTTREFVGGVAVSLHRHIERVWRKAIETLLGAGCPTSVHIIVGEPGSAEFFWNEFDRVPELEFCVALPYQASGRGVGIDTESESRQFFDELVRRRTDPKIQRVTLGAFFYDEISKRPEVVRMLGPGLYEPDIFSGYRIMDDSYRLLRRSSYDLSPKFTT